MCDCISEMNALLEPHNTAIVVPLIGPTRALVESYRLKNDRGMKKATHVFANYCPFCGTKYEVAP